MNFHLEFIGQHFSQGEETDKSDEKTYLVYL